MSRVALVSSEPIRERMAGIGIRYLEMARRLPAAGIEVLLLSPAAPAEAVALGLDPSNVRQLERGALLRQVAGCDAIVAQGQWANDVVLEVPGLPVAIDLYDPWLVENLHYAETLGLDPYRNDHASWVLQMTRGDFFLCSSEEQRQFYLGFLAAVGRVNPMRVEADPGLRSLIDAVPFGVPAVLAEHRPWLPARAVGERRLLFGGLYDWYDPWTLLSALESSNRPNWSVLFIRNPNAESTPQRLLGEVESWSRARGWWGSRVQALDWVPSERRYDLLRDVDLLVALHHPSLETQLSLRTRFLDAFAAACSVVVSEGGAVSRLVREHGAGWVVPAEDPPALAAALEQALGDDSERARRRIAGKALAESFTWDRALAPLVEFCRAPQQDPFKESFAHRVSTMAPDDPALFRLRRWWRRRSRW
ncbi:MAG: glycosyltransferase family 4 protein [Acidobacteriota bacterium]